MKINDSNSTLFLVPGLDLQIDNLRKLGFINAYIKDEHREPIFNQELYLLFKPESDTSMFLFIEEEYGNENRELIEDYDYSDGFIVLLYKFPEKYSQEYKHFLNGKYSKFRAKYVAILPQIDSKIDANGDPFTEYSIQFMACHKSKSLKDYWEKRLDTELDDDDEVWVGFSEKRETLNIEKIKQKFVIHESE